MWAKDVKIETCIHIQTHYIHLLALVVLVQHTLILLPNKCALPCLVESVWVANIISSIPGLWHALSGFVAVMPGSWKWGYSTHYWCHFTFSQRQTTGFPSGICMGGKKRIRLVCKLWKWQQNRQQKYTLHLKMSHRILCNACHIVVQNLLVVMKLWLA